MKRLWVRTCGAAALAGIVAAGIYWSVEAGSASGQQEPTAQEYEAIIAQCARALERYPQTSEAGQMLDLLCQVPDEYFKEYRIIDGDRIRHLPDPQ